MNKTNNMDNMKESETIGICSANSMTSGASVLNKTKRLRTVESETVLPEVQLKPIE